MCVTGFAGGVYPSADRMREFSSCRITQNIQKWGKYIYEQQRTQPAGCFSQPGAQGPSAADHLPHERLSVQGYHPRL